MKPNEFRDRLSAHMCDDPASDSEASKIEENDLNEYAMRIGFDS
jgi:hypothetical protein